ncbi:RidA family protein [Oceanirhabdus sp. W0125-5]|uniref:RidA family protein n=1 Tax=Oceanirhabdus sp. W0125-5 TaxID=2999116 RepID=UPI0022F32E24|nr:RidA family protein [Oceanirhabdus sp. W0125-5]WBW94728.1 RidA family protein [Oceanirhabdus sp. W0125-5]
MEIKRIESTGRMSRIVIHANTVYLCGQTCGDGDKGIKEQTQVVLEKIEDLLAKAGSSKEKILSTTIYIKDMAMFSEMNEIWDAWVSKENQPARACVEAKMAREEILVEMSVIAAQ